MPRQAPTRVGDTYSFDLASGDLMETPQWRQPLGVLPVDDYHVVCTAAFRYADPDPATLTEDKSVNVQGIIGVDGLLLNGADPLTVDPDTLQFDGAFDCDLTCKYEAAYLNPIAGLSHDPQAVAQAVFTSRGGGTLLVASCYGTLQGSGADPAPIQLTGGRLVFTIVTHII